MKLPVTFHRSSVAGGRVRASARAAQVLPGADRPAPVGDGDLKSADDEDGRSSLPRRTLRGMAPKLAVAAVLLAVSGAITTVAIRDVGRPAFRSDDFNRTHLSPVPWRTDDPAGDGTVGTEGTWTSDAWLRMSVPAGAEHLPWDTNGALRVTQPTDDRDFEAEVAFMTVPSPNQTQGYMVEQDDENWVQVGFYHDGAQLHLQAATTEGGTSTEQLNVGLTPGDLLRLGLERRGDQWQVEVATTESGAPVPVGSFEFDLSVARSGPYAGNTGERAAPAFDALIDYVVERSAPIQSEDTFSVVQVHQLRTAVEGEGSIARTPDRGGYSANRSVTLTAEPAEGWAFAGWTGDLSGTTNPTNLVMDQPHAVGAVFVEDTSPPQMASLAVNAYSATAIVRWTTDEPSTSIVDVGTGTEYETGSFGSEAMTRDHSVTITGLQPGTTYHYRASSADGAELTSATADATFVAPASGGPAIDVWHGYDRVVGANGRSQTWVNIGGNVSDPEGVVSMSASLNGGPSRPVTVGPDARRLQAPGDFNAEVAYDELRAGANPLVLTAVDGAGAATSVTVSIEYRQAAPPPQFTTDWGAATRVDEQAQPVDGRWALDGDSLRIVELGYDRVVTVGDLGWHDYEVSVPVTVHDIGPGSGGVNSGAALVGMGIHWQGHTRVNNEQPARNWYPTGALAWYRWHDDPKFELRGNGDEPILRTSHLRLEFGRTYMFKARSQTVAGGVQYSFKAWPQGRPEPSAWDMTILEDAGPATGAVALIAHHAEAQFGDITVTSVTPP